MWGGWLDSSGKACTPVVWFCEYGNGRSRMGFLGQLRDCQVGGRRLPIEVSYGVICEVDCSGWGPFSDPSPVIRRDLIFRVYPGNVYSFSDLRHDWYQSYVDYHVHISLGSNTPVAPRLAMGPTHSLTRWASWPFRRVWSYRVVKLKTRLHLLPRLRIHGVRPATH